MKVRILVLSLLMIIGYLKCSRVEEFQFLVGVVVAALRFKFIYT